MPVTHASHPRLFHTIARMETNVKEEMLYMYLKKPHPLLLPLKELEISSLEVICLFEEIEGVKAWQSCETVYTEIEKLQFCIQLGCVEQFIGEMLTVKLSPDNVYVGVYGQPLFLQRGICGYVNPMENNASYYLNEWKAFCVATLCGGCEYIMIRDGTYLMRKLPNTAQDILETTGFSSLRHLLVKQLENQREGEGTKSEKWLQFVPWIGYILFAVMCIFHIGLYLIMRRGGE